MNDFDNIDEGEPKLAAALAGIVSEQMSRELASSKLRYVEDACNLLLRLAGRDQVIDATLQWLSASPLAAYHGTRMTDAEVSAVQRVGLLPLNPQNRRERITRALSRHPAWHDAEPQLEEALRAFGSGQRSGGRVGQVHLTLSKAGLTQGFSYYLRQGAEFDMHVAAHLLGDEGVALLCQDGLPRVFQCSIPGDVALKAAHRHFTVEMTRACGEVPNLVKEFLQCWSYRQINPLFQSRTLRKDCGLVFREIVSAGWVTGVETLAECSS